MDSNYTSLNEQNINNATNAQNSLCIRITAIIIKLVLLATLLWFDIFNIINLSNNWNVLESEAAFIIIFVLLVTILYCCMFYLKGVERLLNMNYDQPASRDTAKVIMAVTSFLIYINCICLQVFMSKNKKLTG